MFRVLTLAADGRVTETSDVATITPPGEGEIRWIDLVAQDAAQMEVLERAFHFHPLAIEDCLHVDQRPKLEEYGDYVFIGRRLLRVEMNVN